MKDKIFNIINQYICTLVKIKAVEKLTSYRSIIFNLDLNINKITFKIAIIVTLKHI